MTLPADQPGSPRVELRPPTRSDEEPFLQAMRASRRFHQPWMNAPTTTQAYELLMARASDPRHDPLLACRLEDGAIVGFFNLSEIVRSSFQCAYLGYGAVAAHAGRGYMTEAIELVLARAFGPLELHRVEANIQPGNRRSLALVQRAGFVREGFSERYLRVGGEWRDHERWAITAEHWHARRQARGALLGPPAP